ncbi:MAG: hypothetical protein F6K30_25175 [Cyanothece sp. SIO2G6]|nr:hypothetical protein [Cyanothece sp. SIO2G6]
MSQVIQLTQQFYQERQAAVDADSSQEMIDAKHVGWNSAETQINAFEVATDLPWINWQDVESVLAWIIHECVMQAYPHVA